MITGVLHGSLWLAWNYQHPALSNLVNHKVHVVGTFALGVGNPESLYVTCVNTSNKNGALGTLRKYVKWPKMQ